MDGKRWNYGLANSIGEARPPPIGSFTQRIAQSWDLVGYYLTLPAVSPILNVAEVIAHLTSHPNTIRAEELCALLIGLGFTIKQGTKGNHRKFLHAALSKKCLTAIVGSFDAGHGKNAEVKGIYVKNVVKLLSKYESDLQVLL